MTWFPRTMASHAETHGSGNLRVGNRERDAVASSSLRGGHGRRWSTLLASPENDQPTPSVATTARAVIQHPKENRS
jgi:hypothetical protein